MPMGACKALLEVHAGVIPGSAMAEYTKRWSYNSDDYEHDKTVLEDQETTFTALLKEAHLYAMTITNPAYVNWVQVNWMWI